MLALHTKTVPPKSQLSRTDEQDNPVKPCKKGIKPALCGFEVGQWRVKKHSMPRKKF